MFFYRNYIFSYKLDTGKQSFDSSSKTYITHRALCHQVTGKQKGFLALPHLFILLRLQTKWFINWIGLKQRTSKKQMCFTPKTESTKPMMCPFLSSDAKMPLSSLAFCYSRAVAVWAKEMSALVLINAELKTFPFHILFQKESDRGNSPGIFHWTQSFSVWAKGNQNDLMSIKYLIVRQSGGEHLPRRLKKKIQPALKMHLCSYSEVLNCIISIETSTFTNVCNSNISTEWRMKLFKSASAWICKQRFIYNLIAIYFLLMFTMAWLSMWCGSYLMGKWHRISVLQIQNIFIFGQ